MFIVAVLLMLTIATTVRSDGVWHDRPARAASQSGQRLYADVAAHIADGGASGEGLIAS